MSPQVWPPVPPRVQRGSAAGVTNTAFTTVTFLVPFASVPIVLPAARALSSNAAPHLGVISTTGFTVALSSQSAVPVTGTIDWIAIA